MNCREINFILDTHATEALTSAQRAAVDGHLASCEDCRADWANWHGVAALAIPPTPPELRTRVAAMMPAVVSRSGSAARRPGRGFLIGGLLLAGAALAAALALRDTQDSPLTADEPSAQSTPISGAALAGVQSMPPAELAASADDAAAPRDAASEAGAPFEGGLDPLSVVVLARPEAVAGAFELEEFAKCHAAIVGQLQDVVGINVIAGPRVASFDGSGLDDFEIARSLGAGYLFVVSTENGCNTRLHDSPFPDSWVSGAGGMYGQIFPAADGWVGFARTMAFSVREALLENPASRVAVAHATLFDAALSDRERIHALTELHDGGKPMPGAFDSSVVAAAALIGSSSPDADARTVAWTYLHGVDDNYLVQPLMQALATDPSEDVRRAAARALNTFLDEPGVRDALLRAAAEDPSREPSVVCCLVTVRETAEWASVATADLPAFARGKLFDDSLPARSRLLWLSGWSPDGRFIFLRDLGADAPAAVFDIGRNEQDPRVRQMAWKALSGRAHNAAFVPVLLDDLKNHPDEYVRSSAATALSNYIDLPEVQAAFEEARNDPSMEVRRVVERDSP
jgi:hypothetical protein